VCGPCFRELTELVPLSDTGIITAFSVVNYPFIDPNTGAQRPIPYTYGYIKLDAYHDNRVPSHQEVPFWVRQNTPWGDDGFGMTAKESRLGADLRGPTVAGGKVEGKVELDFYADVANPDALDNTHAFKPRSRQLYLQWSDDDWTLLAGQAWEPYVINLPNTLNFTYYSFQGELGLRKTQLRLTRRIDLGEGTALELTGAAIDPTGRIHGGDLDGDAQDDCADSGLPMFASKAVLKPPIFGRKAEFGIAGVYALEEYDTMDKELDVWAVQGGWNIPLTQRLTWKLNAFAGSNLDSLWGGIGQGVNLGMNRAIDAIGGWTQLQFTASDKLSFNLGLSADNPSDDDLSSGGRTLNTTWLLNGYYNFNPSLILGLEFLHGETGYLQAGEPRKTATTANNRVQSSLIYKF